MALTKHSKSGRLNLMCTLPVILSLDHAGRLVSLPRESEKQDLLRKFGDPVSFWICIRSNVFPSISFEVLSFFGK